MGTVNRALSGLTERYAFVDSATVTGHFKTLSFIGRGLLRDCNFNFDSDIFSVCSIDGMFEGCENAVFSSELHIRGNTVTSAASAFRNCIHARLPVVDIGSSSLSSTERMFENCYCAEMKGASVPDTSVHFAAMFRNSNIAFFNEISSLPAGDGNYVEMFSGCENGAFTRLRMDGIADTSICSYMFYYCGNMDSSDLGMERVSEKIRYADYMFYSAGDAGSHMMDGRVFTFSSLEGCASMFTNSNFAFNDSFYRFDGSSVTSLSAMFSGCNFCNGRSPVVILGHSNGGEIDISNVDALIDGRLYGHYGGAQSPNPTGGAITDFSSMYENSLFSVLDIRGISNNAELSETPYRSVQNMESMCRGCYKMTAISGYIPTNAGNCKSLFDGCSSLSADISRLFLWQSSSWKSITELDTAFRADANGGVLRGYGLTDISAMFRGCAYIFSTSDAADIVALFKCVLTNLGGDHEAAVAAVADSMPPMRIATKNPPPGFGSVKYDITYISHDTGTVRYNSFVDEDKEISDGKPTEFGLYSDYAKSAFSRGFYRYGGRFTGTDSDKCFFLIYTPERDSDGNVIGFSTINKSGADNDAHLLVPHNWQSLFGSNVGYWNDFAFGKLCAGLVCDLEGRPLKYAYIGNYTRKYYENHVNGSGDFVVQSTYDMPVTFFDGLENTITPL